MAVGPAKILAGGECSLFLLLLLFRRLLFQPLETKAKRSLLEAFSSPSNQRQRQRQSSPVSLPPACERASARSFDPPQIAFHNEQRGSKYPASDQ